MKTREMFLCTIDREDGELVTFRLAPVDLGKLLGMANDVDRSATELLKANDLDPNRKRRSMRIEHAQDLMSVSSRIREALGVSE